MKRTKRTAENVRANEDIRARHMKRQKRKRKRRIFFRAFLLLLILTAAAASVMFLTPWFNITQITVNGNSTVQTDSIIAQSGIYNGANIFKISTSYARDSLAQMPYIKSVEVNRILPSAIEINVTESHKSACLPYGGGYAVIDEDGKALENVAEQPEGCMQIIGCELQKFEPGHEINVDLDEKFDIIILYIDELSKAGLLDKVTSLDITNVVDIKFKLENRLDVFCGDSDGLYRKLLTFNEVAFNQLSPNARGEIDLRIDGRAHYRP